MSCCLPLPIPTSTTHRSTQSHNPETHQQIANNHQSDSAINMTISASLASASVSAWAQLESTRVRFVNSSTSNHLVGEIHCLPRSSFSSSSSSTAVNASGPTRRVAILCHGLKGDKRFHYFAQLSRTLLCEQLTDFTFAFDFHGFGESEGTHKEGHYGELVADIQAAVEFVQQQRMQVVALIGRSMGGNAVWLYASQVAHDIPFVIGTCARFTFQDGRRFLVTRNAKHTKIANYEFPLRTHRSHHPIHYLIIHGTADVRIPVSDSSLYYQLLTKSFGVPAAQCDVIQIAEADHNFTEPTMANELVHSITQWMKSKTSKKEAKL